jgi:hypothetical protein
MTDTDFGVAVSLDGCWIYQRGGLQTAIISVRQSCLAPDDFIPSMELGDLSQAQAHPRPRLSQRRWSREET